MKIDYNKKIRDFIENYQGSHIGQLAQDRAVMALTDRKKHGYFVEFGVCDGRYYSNTWLLESELAWTGIVAEAAKCFHDALSINRRCHIDKRAVAAATGQRLNFKETETELGLSGLTDYFELGEMHTQRRHASAGTVYAVDTVSLNDLLHDHDAPHDIDYMSIDTEGSEFAILSTFDFDRYRVNIFTIEHNYLEPRRTDIRNLLDAKGYVLIDPALSGHDDWFVLPS